MYASCALVLLPGSPVIQWLSNKFKCNLRTSGASGERGKTWRELITGLRRARLGRGPYMGPHGAMRKDGIRLRQLVQGRLTSQQPDTTGGTRIQGLGTRGLRYRPLTPPTTYFLWKGGRGQITPSPTLPGRRRLEPVYPGSQIPSHQVRRNGVGWGCVCSPVPPSPWGTGLPQQF